MPHIIQFPALLLICSYTFRSRAQQTMITANSLYQLEVKSVWSRKNLVDFYAIKTLSTKFSLRTNCPNTDATTSLWILGVAVASQVTYAEQFETITKKAPQKYFTHQHLLALHRAQTRPQIQMKYYCHIQNSTCNITFYYCTTFKQGLQN